ncbi:MAG: hypothetical protein E1N59_3374 [Puniceicoccaceae bacterium 5H]|nr:MAG: hypothetical protein E1N59_3374 [Puniceicoccaceae bacterium 5H]
MDSLGKTLVVAGLLLTGVGLIVWLLGGRGWLNWFGHLPGDIRVEGERGGFYFPLTTCIVISVALSLLMWLFRR